jgi:ABC-type transport system involved in multi-copper enzyme maturation permease subunit
MNSAAIEAVTTEEKTNGSEFSLWLRQIQAILRIEVKKNFWGVRSILIYLLALLPIGITALMAVTILFLRSASGEGAEFREGFEQIMTQTFSGLYSGLILRTIIFFGCAWIFMNLFRGEVVDRSLHYYFLCSVRREVLVIGKYLSGLVAAIVIFSITTIGSLFFLYVAGFPSSLTHLTQGGGVKYALIYLGITVLACIGYGAFFLLVGLFFRNPIIPALMLYGWEWINFLLPPLLKKISVIHYLRSLDPVPMDEGPFAVLVEPTPAWISIPSLLFVTAVVLAFACWRIRKMEISYGGE